MLIKVKARHQISEAHVTPEAVYRDRRRLLQALGFGGIGMAALPARADLLDKLLGRDESEQDKTAESDSFYGAHQPEPLSYRNLQSPKPDFEITPELKVATHNNFYEFGTQKTDPYNRSRDFVPVPWTLQIGGEVAKPKTIDVWELIHSTALEERIYRFRCVEAWSMNVPWIGIELGQLLKQVEPTSRGKYVAFQTLYDPERMPGQKHRHIGGGIDYPYVEGLRIDEAMHPLTILVVGMYGKTLPAQNGAPIRLMSPWKYGFKGVKSIVKIDLVESMPPTTWNLLAPHEYGFYANVNPAVDHPRWSQASERFIGDGIIARRQPTLPFNGYAEEVATLYAGMDLRRYY